MQADVINSQADHSVKGRLDSRRIQHALSQQIGTFLLFALQAVLTARWLGPSSKGELAVATQLGTVASGALLLGFPSAVGAFVSRGLIRGRQVLVLSAGMLVCGGVMGGILAHLGGWISPAFFQLAFVVLPIAVVLNGALLTTVTIGYAWGESSSAAIASLFCNAAIAAGYAVSWLSGAQGRAGLATGIWLAGLAFGLMTGLVLLRHRLSDGPSAVSLRLVGDIVHTGLRTMLGPLLVALNLRIDILILGWLLSSASVGVYSVSVSLALACQLVPQAVGMALSKSFGQRAYAPTQVADVFRRSWLAGLCVACAVLVGAWVLVPLVFGAAFAQAAPMTAIMVMPLAAFGTLGVSSQYALHGLQRPGFQSIVVAITVSLDILALLLLVPAIGSWGAPVASAVSYTVGAAINIVFVARWTGVTMRELLVPHSSDWTSVRRFWPGS